MKECCVSGSIWEGTPTGSDGKIGGVDAYFARPASGSTEKAIVYCTDVFGYQLKNARLIADTLANAGFFVVIPDLYQGDAIPPEMLSSPKLMEVLFPWAARHGPEFTMPVLDAVIADLRANHGVKHLGTLGYCFGARFSIIESATDKVDAVVVAHPSFVQVPAEIEPIRKPTLFILAENDGIFVPEHATATQEILGKKTGIDFQFNHYPGTFHGFAVRGAESDPNIRKARDDALAATTAFFQKHL